MAVNQLEQYFELTNLYQNKGKSKKDKITNNNDKNTKEDGVTPENASKELETAKGTSAAKETSQKPKEGSNSTKGNSAIKRMQKERL